MAISIWKDTQHQQTSERCKLKPQWDTASHWSEWPSLTNEQTSAGEDAEKKESKCTAGRNAAKQYGNFSEN